MNSDKQIDLTPYVLPGMFIGSVIVELIKL